MYKNVDCRFVVLCAEPHDKEVGRPKYITYLYIVPIQSRDTIDFNY